MVNPFKFGSVVEDENRLVIIFDEFQEIIDINSTLDRQLRSTMQLQKHINYILLGSQESMMSDIFEKKKSPFYHFGEMMRLSKIPRNDFEGLVMQYIPPVTKLKILSLNDISS